MLAWGGAEVARLAHNQKVGGSIPSPATNLKPLPAQGFFCYTTHKYTSHVFTSPTGNGGFFYVHFYTSNVLHV